MNLLLIAGVCLIGSIVPFVIGTYKDAKHRMHNLDNSLKKREEYKKEISLLRQQKQITEREHGVLHEQEQVPA